MRFYRPLALIETLLNGYLHLDPEIEVHLAKLAGKVVAIELARFCFYCMVTPQRIVLSDHHGGAVDVRLRADLCDYLGMMVAPETPAGLRRLQVNGDLEVLGQFKVLFSTLHIDWEEQLARIVGDPIAYSMMQWWRRFWLWAKTSKHSLQLNLSDYLQVERALLPPRQELDDFFTTIDQMRDDVARLQVRMNRLQRQQSLCEQ